MPLFDRFDGFEKRKAEIDEELESHLRMATRDRIDEGEPPAEARINAQRELGNRPMIADAARDSWGWVRLERLLQDVRYALRQIRRSPGFAAAVVCSLGLGIGAPVAMFTISYGVLLRPLPFADSRQLYQPVELDSKDNSSFDATYEEIREWQDATHGTAEIAFSTQGLAILDAPGGAMLISKIQISENLLPILGVQPALGRSFLAQEQANADAHVVLISDAMWRQEFLSDAHILGRAVHIAGVPYTIVGVMPPRFEFPVYDNRNQVWAPLERNPQAQAKASDMYSRYGPVVRVSESSSKALVEGQLLSVQKRIAETASAGEEVDPKIRLMNLHDYLVSDVRPALTALEIAVALVWLIACFNVAGLMMARIAERRTEIAVRGALGAGRMRILSQYLTESLLLSGAGALAGLGLAATMLQLFRRLLQRTLPLAHNIQFNWAVWTTLILLTLVTGIAFGILPAAIAARSPIELGLRNGGRTGTARTQKYFRGLLLVGEIALSIALLTGAGLMMKTMYALRHVDLGFRTDHVVLTSLTIPSYVYRDQSLSTAAWNPLLESVAHMPGVESAALSTVMPIGHTIELLTVVYATPWTKGNVDAVVRGASPELMNVLGIRMRSGRFFTAQDTVGTLPVVVVNQTFVNRYLGGDDALGKQVRFGRVPTAGTIVGVIDDIHQDSVAAPSHPELYVCMQQLTPGNTLYPALIGRVMELAVRTQATPGAMIPELRRRIRATNSSLAIGEFTTMSQAVDDSLGGQRLAAGVTGFFGGLALLITIVGLYGLLSYSVAQRRLEIGIRMALGADRSKVIRMILRQALNLLVIGMLAGLAIAFWCTKLLNGFLYGVSRNDPWTLAVVPCILMVFGLMAAFVPARRASAIDPVQTLKAD
jgi:predicted permease